MYPSLVDFKYWHFEVFKSSFSSDSLLLSDESPVSLSEISFAFSVANVNFAVASVDLFSYFVTRLFAHRVALREEQYAAKDFSLAGSHLEKQRRQI